MKISVSTFGVRTYTINKEFVRIWCILKQFSFYDVVEYLGLFISLINSKFKNNWFYVDPEGRIMSYVSLYFTPNDSTILGAFRSMGEDRSKNSLGNKVVLKMNLNTILG